MCKLKKDMQKILNKHNQLNITETINDNVLNQLIIQEQNDFFKFTNEQIHLKVLESIKPLNVISNVTQTVNDQSYAILNCDKKNQTQMSYFVARISVNDIGISFI